MPRETSSRKFLLTINNPVEHGYTHENIKNIICQFSGCVYWCMADEIGENGTPHTHVFMAFKNTVMFSTVQKRFYGVHIDQSKGTMIENRDYVGKFGKWSEDKKHETCVEGTFEEWGTLPDERSARQKQSEQVYQMIKDGASNAEIIEMFPSEMNHIQHIESARQTMLEEKYKNVWRSLEVHYIWGETEAGKTRFVMEKYDYENVFRVTNYVHPFDGYKGQDVVLFDEFRSSLMIDDMLKYLDGYPVMLPCRYSDKVACFTKVYIVSNIPFEKQYPNVQINEPETFAAFKRRFTSINEMKKTNFTDEFIQGVFDDV